MNALGELANRAQMERATAVVRATYSVAPKIANATVIGDGLAMVGGLPSTTNIAGGANINTTITVANVGRPAAAIYRGDDGSTSIIAAAASNNNGSGGSLMMAHRLDDLSIHLGPLAESQAPWFGIHVADPDAHHARKHNILSTDDHSITTAKWNLVGASALDTLGVITPSSDVSGPTEAVLKSTASGGLTLATLTAATSVTTPTILTTVGNLQLSPATLITTGANIYATNKLRAPQIDTASGDLSLNPASAITQLATLYASTSVRVPTITAVSHLTASPVDDFLFDPGSNMVKATTGVALQSDHYASQVTGWRMTYTGELDARYIYTDELHAKAFIADLEQALAGGQIISKSVTRLSRNFTAPAPGGSTTLYVEDLPSAKGMAVFQSGDMIRLRIFSRSDGGLTIADCWGTVTGYAAISPITSVGLLLAILTTPTDPVYEQSWTFTRSAAPNAGAMATGEVVQAQSIVLDYGVSGNGFHEVNAIDGLYGANSPYSQIVTWATHPHSGQAVRTRMGNLYGLFSSSGEFGLYAGDGTANTNKYLRLSNQHALLNNIPIQLRNNGTQTVNIDSAGTDIWIGPNSSDKHLSWNGSVLTVKGAITITSGDVPWSSISGTGKPADNATVGATWGVNIGSQPDSLSDINSGEGSKLSGIATGATVGATWGTNLGNIPLRFGDSPSGQPAGLYMTASQMGYWNGSAWKTWIASTGQFYFGGSTGARLEWDGTNLRGVNSSDDIEWYASSTTGKLYAGGGNAILDASGLTIKADINTILSGTPEPSPTPSLTPTATKYIDFTDPARTWTNYIGGTTNYNYAGGSVGRLYNYVEHIVPEYEDEGFWTHKNWLVLDAREPTLPGGSGAWASEIYLNADITRISGALRVPTVQYSDGTASYTISSSGHITLADAKYLATDEVRARDSGGLLLRDDAGTVGIAIFDGGDVGMETLRAYDSSGLFIEDDGGNLGIYIDDGGAVGIKTSSITTDVTLDVNGYIYGRSGLTIAGIFDLKTNSEPASPPANTIRIWNDNDTLKYKLSDGTVRIISYTT